MFKYDQPVAAATHRAAGDFQVSDLAHALWRRKIAIVGAGFICACAAVMVGKSLTPRYTATAQLYVDPRELQLVDRELTPRQQDSTGLSMVVESQARLIASNNVLLRVIEENKLDKDPEFGGPSKGLFGSLLNLTSGGGTPTAADRATGRTVALEALNRHLSVKRTDRTYVIDIDVWSSDPAKAAMIANAISNAYLDESRESQSGAARRATSDLSGRLKELQERLRKAENALAVYKAKNNFVGTQDTVVSDQQLLADTQRLAAAKAQTLDAQARYDQIEANRKAATDAGAIPEALQSQTIANLRAQYAEVRRRYAEMQNELGPRHPSLRNMERQVDDIRRNVNDEVSRFAQSAKNDLARARDYESSLSSALDTQKRQSVDLGQASVRLRELERDVEAGRNVYQSFLKRSRETEEQESLNLSSARVIGEATQPQRRTFPPAMSIIAILGFLAGTLAAAALAIAADRLRPPAAAPKRQQQAEPQPVEPVALPVTAGPSDLHRILTSPPLQAAAVAPVDPLPETPEIARLTESDVARTLTGILAPSTTLDLTKLGWPALRVSAHETGFVRSVRLMRATAARQASAKPSSPKGTLVLAVTGPSHDGERSIVTINLALAAARDGAKVLLIDADPAHRTLSKKMASYKVQGDRGWLGLGPRTQIAIETVNGIAITTISATAKPDTVRKSVADARASGRYDLVVLDGPAMPHKTDDAKLFDIADGVVVALPVSSDVDHSMNAIITGLGGSDRKISGVVIDELQSAFSESQRRQYA